MPVKRSHQDLDTPTELPSSYPSVAYTDNLSPESLAMLKAGLDASARNEVVDLGSFCDDYK